MSKFQENDSFIQIPVNLSFFDQKKVRKFSFPRFLIKERERTDKNVIFVTLYQKNYNLIDRLFYRTSEQENSKKFINNSPRKECRLKMLLLISEFKIHMPHGNNSIIPSRHGNFSNLRQNTFKNKLQKTPTCLK